MAIQGTRKTGKRDSDVILIFGGVALMLVSAGILGSRPCEGSDTLVISFIGIYLVSLVACAAGAYGMQKKRGGRLVITQVLVSIAGLFGLYMALGAAFSRCFSAGFV